MVHLPDHQLWLKETACHLSWSRGWTRLDAGVLSLGGTAAACPDNGCCARRRNHQDRELRRCRRQLSNGGMPHERSTG